MKLQAVNRDVSGEMVWLVDQGMHREQGAGQGRRNAQHLLGRGEAECLGARHGSVDTQETSICAGFACSPLC